MFAKRKIKTLMVAINAVIFSQGMEKENQSPSRESQCIQDFKKAFEKNSANIISDIKKVIEAADELYMTQIIKKHEDNIEKIEHLEEELIIDYFKTREICDNKNITFEDTLKEVNNIIEKGFYPFFQLIEQQLEFYNETKKKSILTKNINIRINTNINTLNEKKNSIKKKYFKQILYLKNNILINLYDELWNSRETLLETIFETNNTYDVFQTNEKIGSIITSIEVLNQEMKVLYQETGRTEEEKEEMLLSESNLAQSKQQFENIRRQFPFVGSNKNLS